MSSIRTPSERYRHDVAFHNLTDALVALMRDGWTYGDIHDAWALAEQIKHENEVRRLSTGGSDAS
jgi:hypothetical protein